MQFVITAKDGENMLAKRMEVRPRHLENMERMKEHIICAGGLLDGEGKMTGSGLILDFASRGELDAYLAKEPYVTEGVWRQGDVQSVNVVIVKGEKVR